MVMYDPSHECIRDFWKEGILKGLPVSSNNPRFLKAASQLRSSVDDSASDYEIMKHDFVLLFSGNGSASAPPFESVYRGGEILIYGKPASPVREFYNSYGWESKFQDSVPDDHVGVELLFLTLMIEKYLDLDDDACHREMQNEIKRFIDTHIMSWIPEWNRDIQEKARTLGYKGIGTLILACTEDIYGLMGDLIS
jgi:TorA maturation chaperone TorD